METTVEELEIGADMATRRRTTPRTSSRRRSSPMKTSRPNVTKRSTPPRPRRSGRR